MNWIKATRANLATLQDGTVCWVIGSSKKPEAAVFYSNAAERGNGSAWRCHGQEHFAVSGVTRYIVLPAR